MKLKWLIQSLNNYFAELVKRLENHEAVASEAINDIRKNTSKLKVQLKQTQVRLSQLEAQKLDLERSYKLWRKRAKQEAYRDKEKALRCVQAYKNKESFIIILDEQIQSTKYQENDLKEHVFKAEQKLIELLAKNPKSSTRRPRAKLSQPGRLCYPNDIDHDDIFIRWEEKFLADKFLSDYPHASKDFEGSYNLIDDKLRLELELESLLTEDEVHQD